MAHIFSLFGNHLPLTAGWALACLVPLIATSIASSESATPARGSIDLLTVAAIATIAFIDSNILHEGMGHGLACVALGGDPVALSTAYFDCDFESVSEFGRTFVAAAGSLINVAAGVASWILLGVTRNSGGRISLFLWLSMAVNLLAGTGYLLFSGVIGIGDWDVVTRGLEPIWMWRGLLVVSGLASYLLCVAWLLRELSSLLNLAASDWLKTGFKVTFSSYLAGSIASTIGAFLNPISPVLILTSAASAFGGASGLAWMTQLYKLPGGRRFMHRTGRVTPETFEVTRSWTWIAAAFGLLLVHIFVLGPSITF